MTMMNDSTEAESWRSRRRRETERTKEGFWETAGLRRYQILCSQGNAVLSGAKARVKEAGRRWKERHADRKGEAGLTEARAPWKAGCILPVICGRRHVGRTDEEHQRKLPVTLGGREVFSRRRGCYATKMFLRMGPRLRRFRDRRTILGSLPKRARKADVRCFARLRVGVLMENI
ncbi:hypothetical protein KM043_009487 [Ampulex compressa]|nr:hypothetical protein KM043_009487 [Ampulex compressa]